jgi:hypothetical protein
MRLVKCLIDLLLRRRNAREREIDAWFAKIDRHADVPFMEDGRRQPPMPETKN